MPGQSTLAPRSSSRREPNNNMADSSPSRRPLRFEERRPHRQGFGLRNTAAPRVLARRREPGPRLQSPEQEHIVAPQKRRDLEPPLTGFQAPAVATLPSGRLFEPRRKRR